VTYQLVSKNPKYEKQITKYTFFKNKKTKTQMMNLPQTPASKSTTLNGFCVVTHTKPVSQLPNLLKTPPHDCPNVRPHTLQHPHKTSDGTSPPDN